MNIKRFNSFKTKKVDEKKKYSDNDLYYMIYGGRNTNPNPFVVGDKLSQIWGMDENDNLIPGRGLYEFIGMKDDLMLLKTLNSHAAYSDDTTKSNLNKKLGYRPKIGQTLQLHYRYADRFKVVE